ncbi:MAG: M48 family metalloprotease [Hyphomicrobiales bacterium]|nr:M48 family metalloprotease [Hyphomicrobiales bacterium]
MTETSIDHDNHRRHRLQNTLQTALLAAGSVLLLALCAYAFAGPTGVVWAIIGGAISVWLTMRLSPRVVLGLYRAQKLKHADFPFGTDILQLLADRAGLKQAPTLYLVPSRMMNAFSVGRPDDAAIAVTDGLLRGLNSRELTGVLAHEIAHIANNDIRVMALADMVSRMTSVMSTVGILALLFNLPAIMVGGAQIPWIGVGLLIAAPTIGGLLQLALSRTREYDADLSAAGFTGDPEGLAVALVKLEKAHRRVWEGLMLPGARLPDPSVLRTHPATKERVERLLALRSERAEAIDHTAKPHVIGKSLVPITRPPRVRLRGMGLWY